MIASASADDYRRALQTLADANACDAIITIFVPALCIVAMTRSISCVAAGSRFAVGSSKNNTSGSCNKPRAMCSRCRIPRE